MKTPPTHQHICLPQCVEDSLTDFFNMLDGEMPTNLYTTILAQVEPALLSKVMQYTQGNKTKAATVLGINRNTLCKKLNQYALNK